MAGAIRKKVILEVGLAIDPAARATLAGLRAEAAQPVTMPVGVGGGGGGSGASTGGTGWGGRAGTSRSANPWANINRPPAPPPQTNAWTALANRGTSYQQANRDEMAAQRAAAARLADQKRITLYQTRLDNEAQRGRDKVQNLQFSRSESLRDASSRFLTAGSGALDVLKNLSLLAATSEKDIEKLARRWAMLMSTFDAAQGTITTITSIAAAIDKLRKAQLAQASINTLSGGAAGATAAGAPAAGVAGGSISSTLLRGAGRAAGFAGRAIATVAAPVAAVVGGVYAGNALSKTVWGGKEGTWDVNLDRRRIEARERERTALIAQTWKDRNSLEGVATRREASDRRTNLIFDVQAAQRANLLSDRQATADRIGGQNGVAFLRRGAQLDIAKARRAVEEAGGKDGIGNGVSLEAQKRAAEQMAEARKNMLDAEKRGHDLLQQELQQRKSITAELRDQVQAARDRVRQEEKGVGSLRAQIGRLSQSDQRFVMDVLTQKENGQEITKLQAQRLDRTGVLHEFSDKFYDKQMLAAGFTDEKLASSNTDQGAGLLAAREELERLRRDADFGAMAERKVASDINKSTLRTPEAQAQATNAQTDANRRAADAGKLDIGIETLAENGGHATKVIQQLTQAIGEITVEAARTREKLNQQDVFGELGEAITKGFADLAGKVRQAVDSAQRLDLDRRAQNRG